MKKYCMSYIQKRILSNDIQKHDARFPLSRIPGSQEDFRKTLRVKTKIGHLT